MPRRKGRALIITELLPERSDKLDDSHLGSVAATGTDLCDAGVTAAAVRILGSDLLEQLSGDVLFCDERHNLSLVGERVLFSYSDHLLRHGSSLLGAGKSSFNLAILK